MHHPLPALLAWGGLLARLSRAACPYADPAGMLGKRDDADTQSSPDILEKYKIDDSSGYMTSDVGGPMGDQFSLRAGIRGSTLLEDFIFRQKIQHFDHERVSDVVVSWRWCWFETWLWRDRDKLTWYRRGKGSGEGCACEGCGRAWHVHELWGLE